MTDNKLREAAENLVAVCDDLEAKSAVRTGGSRMSGYWLQRNRIDPVRAALADSASTNADTNQYLLVEPTEEMVEAGFGAAVRGALWETGTATEKREAIRDVLRAALAAAHEEG